MKLSIIVAIGNNNEIGQRGSLLFHSPADLKHFKEITRGHTVVMGRKTFESLPNGVLPYRRNIILSRNNQLKISHAEVCSSLNMILKIVEQDNEVFIIGGSQLYQQTLSLSTTLYLTKIHTNFPNADVFFPFINNQEWKEINRKELAINEKNVYSLSFIQYKRIRQVSTHK